MAVVPPRLSIDAFLLQTEVGPAQCFQIVDVVQKRREWQLLVLICCLTYPLQRAERVFPARCPGRVLLGQVPFGQTSSLHPPAAGCPVLFGDFSGTVGLSDFPGPFVIGVRPRICGAVTPQA